MPGGCLGYQFSTNNGGPKRPDTEDGSKVLCLAELNQNTVQRSAGGRKREETLIWNVICAVCGLRIEVLLSEGDVKGSCNQAPVSFALSVFSRPHQRQI